MKRIGIHDVRAAAVKRIRALSKRMNLRITRAEVRQAIAKGRD